MWEVALEVDINCSCWYNETAAVLPIIFCIVLSEKLIVCIRDGRGSYFFHGAGQGGEGLGKKCMGRGTPPFPTKRGGAGKGSKSAGQGGARAGNS